ncbi:MAG TPA: beta-ketoacyl-[acyl-carrier-protein] synthase family protein [Solirubrobacteraceae bacterium]|nr:beta-ketoacyl-[acyl-carrier-protein] synthase family protein [Solirubrobacteraceae bacterium]
MRRVAITGIGAVTPVGSDAPSTWEALKAGRSGVGPITTFDASTYSVRIAGMVDDFDASHLPDPSVARRLHRAGVFGVGAGAEALADAAVPDGTYDRFERGVSMGASVARPELQEFSDIFHTRHESDGHRLYRAPPSRTPVVSQNVAAAEMARIGGAAGPMLGLSTACTASTHAIGEAFRLIQDGDAKMMLAGGYDALTSWVDVLGFMLLGALTKDYNDDPEHASRPFDRDRTGFVLGEAGVAMVLEDLESARARGAEIYAELAGYASSLNAYRMTDPPPDGGGAVIAMNNALRESGFVPADVDYVVAHGTGTPGGDVSETVGIKRVFGEHVADVAVTSPKSMTGHTTCAAGALNLLAAIGAIRDGVISPTINLDHPDPELDLDYVPNRAREKEVRVAMINSFAFGGTNGAIVLCAPEARDER